MLNKPPRYRTYLLTLWEERSQDPALAAVWGFRLEDPRTGRRRGFGEFEGMMAFLRSELDGGEADPPGE
jgi:hypothetical protein